MSRTNSRDDKTIQFGPSTSATPSNTLPQQGNQIGKIYRFQSSYEQLPRRGFGQELSNYSKAIPPYYPNRYVNVFHKISFILQPFSLSTIKQTQKNIPLAVPGKSSIPLYRQMTLPSEDVSKNIDTCHSIPSAIQWQQPKTTSVQIQNLYRCMTMGDSDSDVPSIASVPLKREIYLKDPLTSKNHYSRERVILSKQYSIDVPEKSKYDTIPEIIQQDNCSTNNSSNEFLELTNGIERQYKEIENMDKINVSNVAQYQREIFAYLKQKEKTMITNKSYMEEQRDLSERMRLILVDWLVDIHYKFKMIEETLFLTVYILDKYLSMTFIKRDQLQLVGVTALYIAAKYEEIYPPDLTEFSNATDKTYTNKEILKMEGQIICALNFQITVPSAYQFAQWYIRLAQFSPKDASFALYFVELSLLDTRFMAYSPSNIAASAVYMVSRLNQASKLWPEILEHDSGFSDAQLRACAKDLILIQQRQQKSKQRAVATKYGTNAHYKVSFINLVVPKQRSNTQINE